MSYRSSWTFIMSCSLKTKSPSKSIDPSKSPKSIRRLLSTWRWTSSWAKSSRKLSRRKTNREKSSWSGFWSDRTTSNFLYLKNKGWQNTTSSDRWKAKWIRDTHMLSIKLWSKCERRTKRQKHRCMLHFNLTYLRNSSVISILDRVSFN